MNTELQSASIAELTKALNKVQAKIEPAAKTGYNPHFKSHYADLPALVNAGRDLLATNGLAITQLTRVSETGEILLVTTLAHISGEWMKGEYPIRSLKGDPQSLGTAFSYARRYTYAGALGITAVEDDDGNAASGEAVNGQAAKTNGVTHSEARAEAEAIRKGEAKYIGGSAVNHELAKIAKGERTMEGKAPSDKSLWKLFFDLQKAGHEWPKVGKEFQLKNIEAMAARITGDKHVTALTVSNAIAAVADRGIDVLNAPEVGDEIPEWITDENGGII